MRPLQHQTFNNVIALGAAAVVLVGTLVGAGLAYAPAGSGASTPSVSTLNLSIDLSPTLGVPYYTPANFTVPAGLVRVTITDHDSIAPFPGCPCNVTGTVGSSETVNGTPLSLVPWQNAAHTFTVPSLGIEVLSPGGSTVSFELDLTQTGSFTWLCEAPCGSDGSSGFPMGVPGFMTGTMTVT